MPSEKVLRKLIIGLFLLTVVLQSGLLSIHSVLRIKQHKALVKSRMKQELKNRFHEANLVVFTEADLQMAAWEHAKEFFLGKSKYDVVRKVLSEKGVLFYCIPDQREIELYKSLDTHSKKTSVIDEMLQKFNLCNQPICFELPKPIHVSLDLIACVNNSYCFDFSADLLRPPGFLS